MTATGRCGGLTQRDADPDTDSPRGDSAPRHCPRCRLPRPPAAIYEGRAASGSYLVLGLCASCERDLDRLPAATRHRALLRALDRADADVDRYLAARFDEAGAAALVARWIGRDEDRAAVLKAIGWR